MNPLAFAAILANPGGVIVLMATIAILTAFNAWAFLIFGSIAALIGLFLFFRWPRVFWFYAGAATIYVESRFFGLSFYIEEILRRAFTS
ncbi:hypothetical protein EJC49_14965 [Aquibium carbonis]|uniref:Uncharacterized protein n=1 Tax=Aquibium carbonis TaxID=2495581 RepID=A0A429YVW7_9HYPH|nr:hypothetical protein [Aquibium carbonis]RST85601.1 hypothetical protein EJC49_14965 [Aquibium carbonis]